jgi:hypothetical protein
MLPGMKMERYARGCGAARSIKEQGGERVPLSAGLDEVILTLKLDLDRSIR